MSGLPLLSIVIPVWNVETYLDACLDSITGQSFRDLEIIAVDGASTDSSASILQERARRDERLHVIHLKAPDGKDRVGPGLARNAGMACAKGEYIWFVDGDDAIEPGCLATIASRIGRAGPDLLFIGNVLVSADGQRTEQGHDQHLLSPDGGDFFTLAERPQVAELSMASWNKIVRRELLLSSRASFLEQWPHEDIPVSCAVLVAAQSIGILSAPCYRYRQDRRGSAMRASDTARHFNVFRAWRTVLSAARDRLEKSDPAMTPEVFAELFERSVWHLTNIYDKGGMGALAAPRYVSTDRRKYFTRMHEHYLAYRPAGYQRPAAFRGIKFRLIENNSYLGYLLLAPLNGLRNLVRQARRPGKPAAAGRP